MRCAALVIAAWSASCANSTPPAAEAIPRVSTNAREVAPAAPAPVVVPAPDMSSNPASIARVADFAEVDARARTWLELSGLPGAALLVIRDHAVVHEAYYGGYTADTVVPVASSSKWLAGALVLSLVDERKLALDDHVSKYLPEFTGDKAAITVRQLFNHTSGLTADSGERGGPLSTLARAARSIARLPLVNPPGRVFHYGGDAMQVGGRVAEVAGGASWNELFAQRIAGPLGLTHTQWGLLGLSRNPQVAGGAASTLGDYGRFVQMLLDGGEYEGKRVLSADAVRELVADHTGSAEIASTELTQRLGSRGYGVGCWVVRKNADGVTTAASSPGAFGFWPHVDFEQHIAVVWMICDRERVHTKGAQRFDAVRLVYEALGLRAEK